MEVYRKLQNIGLPFLFKTVEISSNSRDSLLPTNFKDVKASSRTAGTPRHTTTGGTSHIGLRSMWGGATDGTRESIVSFTKLKTGPYETIS